jgi:hypothetical protein
MSSKGSSTKSVEAYIDATPAYARSICQKLRSLIRKAASDLTEVIKWNSPFYTGRSLVCGFAAFKGHVSLYFHQGALLTDPDHVLSHGEGNVAGRSVKFSSIDALDEKKLTRLVKEAVVIDLKRSEKPKQRDARAPLPIPPGTCRRVAESPKGECLL